MAEFSKPNVNNVWSAQGVMVAPDATKVQTGWEVEKPPREYFNWLEHKQDQFIAHVNQHGLPEWDAETEYQANKSYVRASNGAIFFCVTTHKDRNPLQDVSAGYWREAFGDDGVWATKIPRGFIGMWSGAVNEVPRGWRLCDGTGGTPDLRDRFIVGAGADYTAGATGGTVTATTSSNGAHNHGGRVGGHALTVPQMPSHNHFAQVSNAGAHTHSMSTEGLHHHDSGWGEKNPNYARHGLYDSSTRQTGSGSTDGDNYKYNTSKEGAHTHTVYANGAHSHSVTISSTGEGRSHDHTIAGEGNHSHTVDTRSPYYALAFIMKT